MICNGFTLLELLVVMVILVVLVSLAAPSMESTSKSSAVRSHQKSLLSALAYARGEAVARNKLVSICPSANAETCDTGNDWSGGWLVFVDDGAAANYGSGRHEADEELLLAYEYSGGNSVAIVDPDNGNAALNALSWNFRGFAQDSQRALAIICGRDRETMRARGLLIERSGRVILSRDADGNGVHESAFENDNGISVTADLSCS